MILCTSTASAQLLYQPHTPQFSPNIALAPLKQNLEQPAVAGLVKQAAGIRFAAPGENGSFTTGEAAAVLAPPPSMEEVATAQIASAMTFPAPSSSDLVAAQKMMLLSQSSDTGDAALDHRAGQGAAMVTAFPAPVAQMGTSTGTGRGTRGTGAVTRSTMDTPFPAPARPQQSQLSSQNGTGTGTLSSFIPGENRSATATAAVSSVFPSTSQAATYGTNGVVAFPSPGAGIGQVSETPAAVVLGTPQEPLVVVRDITDANTTYANLENRYASGRVGAATILPNALRRGEVASLDLAALIRRVVENDSRVNALVYRIDAQDSQKDALRGAWRPRLETGFETDYNLLRGVEHSATIGLRQRIFDFGQTEAALVTNEARRILAGARVDNQRFDVAAEFLGAYLTALSAERGIQADTLEISALRTLQSANQRLADTGASSIIAARESQISLNTALSRQSERELDKLRAHEQLASLAGGLHVPVSQKSLTALIDRFMPSTAEQCISQAVSSDPGLSVIEAEMVEAIKHIDEIAIQNLPSIDVVGQTGLTPFSEAADFGIRRNTGFNFAINGDLFDGGVTRAEVQSQQLRIRELEKQRSTAERELALDIRRSYLSVKTLQELLMTQRSSLNLLRTLVSDRKRQSDAGVGLLQDVLNAQVELEKAKNALVTVESDLDRERARLVLLCGNRF